MESLGLKLREAREEHNYTLEQIARDTHISRNYLKALEDEDFSEIPGETYVMGFLRNYAEYLSLNPEELVNLYKNIKIQEQPLPMNELLEGHNRKSPSFLFLIIILCLGVLGTGGFLLYRFVLSPREKEETAPPEAASAVTGEAEYLFHEEVLSRWFNLEDTIKVPVNGQIHLLKLIGIEDKLTLKIPGGTIELNIGEERKLDLNADARIDIRLLLNDLDPRGTVKRANIGFYKVIKGTPAEVAEAEETPRAETSEELGVELPGADVLAGEPGPGTFILKSDSPAPFRVSITFRGYCLFRYLLDGEEREEHFFHRGENFSLDVKKEVTLWISNAGALRVMIAGRDVEMGKPGQVTTKLIHWARIEDTGQYGLEIKPVE